MGPAAKPRNGLEIRQISRLRRAFALRSWHSRSGGDRWLLSAPRMTTPCREWTPGHAPSEVRASVLDLPAPQPWYLSCVRRFLVLAAFSRRSAAHVPFAVGALGRVRVGEGAPLNSDSPTTAHFRCGARESLAKTRNVADGCSSDARHGRHLVPRLGFDRNGNQSQNAWRRRKRRLAPA
jgi:hypothetical protein